jgi:type II restriction enzyme
MVMAGVLLKLADNHPSLEFRHRRFLTKREINRKLKSFDSRLGRALFVQNASIRPDGGITEVRDSLGNWRIVLVGESKHQGNDIENILAGRLQGKKKDQDFMAAGNAIERMHKNVLEIRNYMLNEKHFPYAVFLQGSNFGVESFELVRPDRRIVKFEHASGILNRIDRVTASNFSQSINKNYCENIFIEAGGNTHMLQTASLYCKHTPWRAGEMTNVMLEIAETSLKIIASDLNISA